jgi:hypothetical protein
VVKHLAYVTAKKKPSISRHCVGFKYSIILSYAITDLELVGVGTRELVAVDVGVGSSEGLKFSTFFFGDFLTGDLFFVSLNGSSSSSSSCEEISIILEDFLPL